MFIWNSLAFSMIQQMFAIWSLVPLPFLNPDWTFGNSQFIYCLSLLGEFWALLCKHLEWMQLYSSLNIIDSAFLWDRNKNWPFPVLWPLLSFSNLLAYWVQHFHSIIRIWNSSTGTPSPPLALFIMMLPKAHLTLQSKMSGTEWSNHYGYLGH